MTDYCDTPEERAAHPEARDWMGLAANGNAHAFAFLWRFWNFAHMLDDLIDRDKPVTAEAAMRETLAFVGTIASNPFFQAHRDQLLGLLVQIGATVLDADELAASPDPAAREFAGGMGFGDADLFLHVAYLTGGWDHMRRLKAMRYHKHIAAARARKEATDVVLGT